MIDCIYQWQKCVFVGACRYVRDCPLIYFVSCPKLSNLKLLLVNGGMLIREEQNSYTSTPECQSSSSKNKSRILAMFEMDRPADILTLVS